MISNADTFLKILDKEKDEVSITKWVTFLLNPNNTTHKIIEKILEVTNEVNEENNFLKLYNSKDCVLKYISSEARITDDSIIDILLIFNNFGIIIENKVGADETSDQSLRYEQYGKTLGIPIKYILLKPDYNPHTLQSPKFITLNYSQLSEILKSISESDLEKKENNIYIKEFVKHSDLYLTKIEISEKDIHESENIIYEIINRIKNTIDMTKYQTRDKAKYNCIQIWKNGWNTSKEISNYKGLHYEILFLKEEFYNLGNKNGVRIYFDIHNESTNGRIPKELIPKNQNLFNKIYYFDTNENKDMSINEIINKLQEIINEYDTIIECQLSNIDNF